MSTPSDGPAAAGWYPDPAEPAKERYWDGSDWTAEVRSAGAAPPPPPPLPAGYAPNQAPAAGNTYSTIAIVLGALAILIFPIFLGPAALVLAAIARNKGEERATKALAVAAGGFLLGVLLAVILA